MRGIFRVLTSGGWEQYTFRAYGKMYKLIRNWKSNCDEIDIHIEVI